jgi:hypothetical protein
MVSFYENHFQRFSTISSASSSSKDSCDSQFDSSINHTEKNESEVSSTKPSKKAIDCSRQILFFGPLILCIILFISGIIVFIFIAQQSNKNPKKERKESNRIKFVNPYNSNSYGLYNTYFQRLKYIF